MGAPNTTAAPAETHSLATYGGLFTAVASAVGAWKLFEPKIDRIRAIRNEVGHLEFGFQVFYQIPQYLLIVVSIAIFFFLSLSFVDSMYPNILPDYFPKNAVRVLFSPDNLLWVVLSLSFVAAVIYWNLIPRLLMAVAWALAVLPVPGVRNRFGPNGESLGWHQTAQVMEGSDKGQPLMVDDDAVERVAWTVLAKLVQNAGAAEYAAEPANLTAPEKANIALFGCILEAVHYAHRWPSPSWSEFYAALADIQHTKPLFAPDQLLAFPSGQAFFEALRDQLDAALKARCQPSPPDRGLAAAADLSRAWELLKQRACGDVLRLVPLFAPFLGGRMAWLDRRLRAFPRLDSVGMRPQLIKLLVRWKTLPMSRGVFIQPFAKRQAWLLLQEGALRALPDLKEVTFFGTGQVAIARIVALRVIRRVAALIAQGDSSEARAAASTLGCEPWTRLETADFVLWSWARAAAQEAATGEWDKAKWHWKFEDGRVQRLA